MVGGLLYKYNQEDVRFGASVRRRVQLRCDTEILGGWGSGREGLG